MATFLAGLIIGGYTGALIREELTSPTSEKIENAFEVFKSNEKIVYPERQTSSFKPSTPPSN